MKRDECLKKYAKEIEQWQHIAVRYANGQFILGTEPDPLKRDFRVWDLRLGVFGEDELHITLYENGREQRRLYLTQCTLHKTDGPARIVYGQYGKIQSVEYWQNGLRHREDGPAEIHYGWLYNRRYYYIQGVRLNKQIVTCAEEQSIADILLEDNIERKRIRIERYGWFRFLEGVGANVIDSAVDEISGTNQTLIGVDPKPPDGLSVMDTITAITNNPPFVMLICACPSTARTYLIEVPPGTRTCQNAQNWLIGERMYNSKARIIGAS